MTVRVLMATGFLVLIFAAPILITGCASPDVHARIQTRQLKQVQHGWTEPEVMEHLQARPEVLFAFDHDGTIWRGTRYWMFDTGWYCYLLWKNGVLTHTCSNHTCGDLELTSAMAPIGLLPHADGPASLLAAFESASESPAAVAAHPFKRYDPTWGTPGEWLMWSPIILLVGIPNTPLVVYDAHVYNKIYALDLGQPKKQVLRMLGKPAHTLGEGGLDEVCVFLVWFGLDDKHPISVGFREDKVRWFRHHYNAYEDIQPKAAEEAVRVKDVAAD